MPPRQTPTRSIGLGLACLLFAAVCFAWVVTCISRGYVGVEGRRGHLEYRGAAGVLLGGFYFGLACATFFYGVCFLWPDRAGRRWWFWGNLCAGVACGSFLLMLFF